MATATRKPLTTSEALKLHLKAVMTELSEMVIVQAGTPWHLARVGEARRLVLMIEAAERFEPGRN